MKNPKLLFEFDNYHKNFQLEFNKQWNSFITNCNKNMSKAHQLNIGNHTRPFLVYLGAAANCDFNHLDDILKETALLAVSIEAIHKASVIIDDIIDGDSLRRGQKCMHCEFGEYETVFFAVCMLAHGIQHANHILSSKSNEILHTFTISLLCETIYAMCDGAIEEITSDIQQQTDLEHIQKIIHSETIKLIENSLYIGFLYSGAVNEAAGNIIRDIGRKCGYIFQVMNDLEAFCNPKHTLAYKGNMNSDFLRSRKNIILPYLYHSCSKSDKTKLLALLGGDELCFQEAKKLFDKYAIKKMILKDINDVYNSLFIKLTALDGKIQNNQWIDTFKIYLKYTKNKYQKILNIK